MQTDSARRETGAGMRRKGVAFASTSILRLSGLAPTVADFAISRAAGVAACGAITETCCD
jgi:hypothetical protein